MAKGLGVALCLGAVALLGVLIGGACTDATGGLVPTPTPTPTPPQEAAASIEFPAADGAPLRGFLFPGAPDRLVILMHMYRADQSSWFEAAQRLQADGLSVLTFDFRGFGSSTGERDTATMADDVEGALAFARGRGYPSVLLVGASMGGTAAIVAAGAGSAPAHIDGVIALSAPEEFGDLHALEAMPGVAVPVLLIAGQEDTSARDSLMALGEAGAVPPERQLLLPVEAHGTELLASGEGATAWRAMLQFIDLVWPGVRRPVA